MATKMQTKTEFITIFNNLKTLYSFEFIDEETFNAFLKQIAENLLATDFEEMLDETEIKTQDISKEVRKAKDQALKNKLMYFGSFN
ncbi:MAG: hypothetical protein KAJ72_02160 [Candidatus Heimdallarchaeota archaeon]|nr:hypothetical protein [Candidatus Heimdallarchaeota archaeon]